MRIRKLIGPACGALLVLTVALVVAAVVINWHDVPPSADYLHLNELITDRPQVADAENGFVYLLGIRAPPESDPRYLGARRLTWLESLDEDVSRLDDEPAGSRVDFAGSRAPVIKLLTDDCDSPEWRKCKSTFELLPDPGRWSATDRLLLERYRELILHPAWREALRNPFDGRPFTWSADEQAVIYEGTENRRPERRRQVYAY